MRIAPSDENSSATLQTLKQKARTPLTKITKLETSIQNILLEVKGLNLQRVF